MLVQCSYWNPTENFINSHLTVCPLHSQTMDQAVMGILFIEFPDLHFHIEPVIDSIYIIGTCHFHLYFYFSKNFAVPHFHHLFDLAAPFIAIPLHMAQPAPPPEPLATTPPTLPSQVVPSLSLDDDDDPLKASASSPSSSTIPSDNYTRAELDMANRFLSSASDQRQHPPP